MRMYLGGAEDWKKDNGWQDNWEVKWQSNEYPQTERDKQKPKNKMQVEINEDERGRNHVLLTVS